MSETKNQAAWKQLFAKYSIMAAIEKNGYYTITASQINEFRQARLMTKFDYNSQLPRLFQQQGISILPNSRGSYILARMTTFHTFEQYDTPPQRIEFPSHLQSIDYNHITSESAALNCAYISGMLANFVSEKELLPTVNGRMGSSTFNFDIDRKQGQARLAVQVENAQLEIDGGYEGEHALYLIEAKNTISDDFLVRQLYYPYRLWSQRVQKPVRSLFLTYTNGIFYFREYDFPVPNHYNSIQLVRARKYVLRERLITRKVVEECLQKAVFVEESKLPFPQADAFERVINLCEEIQKNESLTKELITENYDFDTRQSDYYTSAARYLGWIEKEQAEEGIRFVLTPIGAHIFTQKMSNRQLSFIETILSHRVFHQVLTRYFELNKLPPRDEIVAIMQSCQLYNIQSIHTYQRRAATVASWVNWIVQALEDESTENYQMRLF